MPVIQEISKLAPSTMLARFLRPATTAAASSLSVCAASASATTPHSARSMSAAAAADPVKHWALQYSYVPDVFEKRAPLRPAHLALASSYKAQGKMLMGGAFTESPMGALLTFHSTRKEVEDFVKADPYVSSPEDKKVVTEYKIREWTVVIGGNQPSEVVKVGDVFPKGLTLNENTPATNVNVDELLANKRVILFGVPGAFTPGCSKTHLPGYVKDAAHLKSNGIDEIICISINDAFVMSAWGASAGAEGKVRMMADTTGELTKKLGLAIDLSSKLCSIRSKRYSMIIDNGKIIQVNIEPEAAPTGLTCSLASAIKLPNKL